MTKNNPQDEPRVVNRSETPIVYIETKVTLKEWGKANALFPKLYDWVKAHGGAIDGPSFYQYLVIGDFDRPYHLRAGLITKETYTSDGEIIASTIPDGKYISYIHKGHPDRLESSHDLIKAWAKENNHTFDMIDTNGSKVWNGLYELYLSDPDEQSDLNTWETEILYAVVG